MTEIFFIKTQVDLEIADKEGAFCRGKAIAFSFHVAYKSEKLGKTILPVCNYFSHSEMLESLKQREWFLNKFWIPFFKKDPLYAIYADVTVFPFVYFIDEALISLLALNRILSIEQPDRVVNFVGRKNVPCTEEAWEFSVFDSMAEHLCQLKDIEYAEVKRNAEILSYSKQKSQFAVGFNYLRNYFIGSGLVPYWAIRRFLRKGNVNVSLISEKEQQERHQWLFDRIEREDGIKILKPWDGTGPYLNAWSDGLLKKARDKMGAQKGYVRIEKSFYHYKSDKKPYPEILQNHLLNFQWQYLLKMLVEMKMSAERRAKSICSSIGPRLVITSQAHQPRSIASAVAFKSLGVSTIVVPHATLPYRQRFYYRNYDRIVATGKSQVESLERLGVAHERMYFTDDYRYGKKPKKRKGDENSLIRSRFKAKYNINKKLVIAVFTRNLQKGTGLFPKDDVDLSIEKTYDFLIACKNLANSLENCCVIFKSHPLRDYFDLYNEFAEDEKVFHIRNESATDVLETSDLNIFLGPLTDVIFLGAIRGKALALCDCGINRELLTNLSNGLRIVYDPERLVDIIKRILANPEYERSRSDRIVHAFLKSKMKHSSINAAIRKLEETGKWCP